jgi:hypothetical protein
MSHARDCQGLGRRLASAGAEDLARLAREAAPHLETCPSCRAELARRDPAALFALLAFEKKDEAFFAGFETRVMAAVRETGREPRLGWLGAVLRPRYLVLAAAAAAIAVVLVARRGPPPQVARGPEPPAAVSSGTVPTSGPLTLLENDAAEPSPVESVASATARVIAIKVAGPQQESSDIVLIVDPEMPL